MISVDELICKFKKVKAVVFIRQALAKCNAEAVAYISSVEAGVNKRFVLDALTDIGDAMRIFEVKHFLLAYGGECKWDKYGKKELEVLQTFDGASNCDYHRDACVCLGRGLRNVGRT